MFDWGFKMFNNFACSKNVFYVLHIIMIFNNFLPWFDIRSMLKRMGLSIYAQNAVLPMVVELHLGRRNWRLQLMAIADYRNQLWRQFELDHNHFHGEKTHYLHQGNPSLHSFMLSEEKREHLSYFWPIQCTSFSAGFLCSIRWSQQPYFVNFLLCLLRDYSWSHWCK